MSIEETLRSIEARQVVGRERELEGIADLLSRSLRDAAAAYVHGPPGAGKTALLQEIGRAHV